MAQSTISQRIALEGAEEILKQFAELGQAAEKFVGQIQAATAGAGPGLTTLSNVSATLHAAIGRLGEAAEPVRHAFSELGEAAHEVGARLVEVANVFSVGLAAGIAGGIAGIFELIKSSAESAHQLEVQSEVLGISILNLKTFGAAATLAGVDSDKLSAALTRFQQNVGTANEQSFQTAAKLLESLPAAASQAGVAIVQGIMPVGTAIKSHIIGNIQDTIPAINNLVEVLRTGLSERGIAVPSTFFEGVRQNLLNTATSATDAGLKIRQLAAQLGVNLPAQTIFEQIQRGAEKAKNPLLELGISFGDLQKLSITDVILKAVDSLEKIDSPTERARLSLALFGRTWPEVLKALRDGSAGFEELRAKVAANNPDLEQNVEKLSGTERALIGVQTAGVNLRNQLAAIFAPAITTAAELFTGFIKNNIDQFKAWAQVIADQLLPGLKNLAAQFGIVGTSAAEATKVTQKLPDVVTGKTGVGVVQTASASPRLVGPQPGETPIAVGARETPIAVNATAVRLSADQLAAQALAIRPEKPLAPVLPETQTPSEASTRPLVDATTAAARTLGQTLGDINNQLEELRKKWKGLSDAGEAAFSLINKALAPITSAFNALFDTDLNNAGVAVVLFSAKAVGAFALIEKSILAVNAAFKGLSILFGLGTTGTPLTAVLLLAIGVVLFRDRITKALEDVQKALGDFLQTNVGDRINALFSGINFEPFRQAVITALDGARMALDSFLQIFADFFEKTLPDLIARGLARLQPLIDAVVSVAKGILGLGSGGGGGGAGGEGDFSSADSPGLGLDSAATTSTFASGGRVPGGPSETDTVPAWLTPGEFVVRAQAVGHYGSNLLHSINNMRLPFADMLQGLSLGGMVGGAMDSFAPSPSPLMLAAGGSVLAPSAGGGGGPTHSLTLNLGGHNFALDVAPGQVFDKLARHARSSAINSAGRKPSWFAS